ncbi:MAG: hypothetical protein P4L83_21170 [Nevskia sp.]|nr:hypothetical protein [Nevskia sp.]
MPRSSTDICNRALAMIGADRITALGEAGTAGTLCGLLYPELRDTLLADHSWNFALARTTLAAAETQPGWGYSNAFPLPADCLRVLRLNVADPTTDWKVEGRSILTNVGAPLQILYIRQVTDPVRFSPPFVDALVHRMAAELAMAMQNNASERDRLVQVAEARLRIARSQDAAEGRPDLVWADTFILARF